jgi:hypothetical protein
MLAAIAPVQVVALDGNYPPMGLCEVPFEASGAAFFAKGCMRASSGRPITLDAILAYFSRSGAVVEKFVDRHTCCKVRCWVSGGNPRGVSG